MQFVKDYAIHYFTAMWFNNKPVCCFVVVVVVSVQYFNIYMSELVKKRIKTRRQLYWKLLLVVRKMFRDHSRHILTSFRVLIFEHWNVRQWHIRYDKPTRIFELYRMLVSFRNHLNLKSVVSIAVRMEIKPESDFMRINPSIQSGQTANYSSC